MLYWSCVILRYVIMSMYDTSHELYWSCVIRVPSKQQT